MKVKYEIVQVNDTSYTYIILGPDYVYVGQDFIVLDLDGAYSSIENNESLFLYENHEKAEKTCQEHLKKLFPAPMERKITYSWQKEWSNE